MIGRTFDHVPGELIPIDECPGKLTADIRQTATA